MRFSIRDVLWLTVVVALGVGILVVHLQRGTLAAKNALLESHKQFLWQRLESVGFDVHYNLDGGSGISIRKRSNDRPQTYRKWPEIRMLK